MPRTYKSRKFGEKISARFRDMNFRNFGKKSTFLELGEFPMVQNIRVDVSWSRLGVCQIWSESVELMGPLRTFFCLSPCRPMGRADGYTIYVVDKGLVTESVIRTPLQQQDVTMRYLGMDRFWPRTHRVQPNRHQLAPWRCCGEFWQDAASEIHRTTRQQVMTCMHRYNEPGADPRVQAVSLQVSISHPPGGGCHYFPPGLQLPSQSQSITAPWPVPRYTAWWQRHIGVNNLPKVVMQLCSSRNWTHDLLIASTTLYPLRQRAIYNGNNDKVMTDAACEPTKTIRWLPIITSIQTSNNGDLITTTPTMKIKMMKTTTTMWPSF